MLACLILFSTRGHHLRPTHARLEMSAAARHPRPDRVSPTCDRPAVEGRDGCPLRQSLETSLHVLDRLVDVRLPACDRTVRIGYEGRHLGVSHHGGPVLPVTRRPQERSKTSSTGTLTAQCVVLAAGTWGTQNLLHKMKDTDTLRALSDRLGVLTRTNSESILGAMKYTVDPRLDLTPGRRDPAEPSAPVSSA